MAKSTTTSKAKTNTSKKKPASKAAAKTTKSVAVKAKKTAPRASTKSTKSTKSTVKAPVKTVAAAKVASKQSSSSLSFLQRGQVILAATFAILAALAGVFMNNESVQVLFSHLTKDELASRSGTVLAPAAHVLYEVEFRWLVVGFLSLAAVIALLRGTRYFARETAGIKAKVSQLRWIDYALTGAVAFSIAGLLNGLQDVVALKLGAVSILVAAFLAWEFEREQAATGKAARSTFVASAVLTVLPVIALAVTMYATWMYGMVRSPWYAYAAAGIVALSLLLTTRMQWKNFKNASYSYVFVDRRFNNLAVLSKVALAAVLIVGLYK